ncbi:MAG TPA: GTPase Era [Syntrophales bacterium]|nr:GTPase Era [Syntrophales bacterium]
MFKSGFIGIIGRPNVGKSTLLNRLIGEKIAITARKPQTTRNRIMGIRNTENAQLIFLDTPGIHRAKDPLNRYMVDLAVGTLAGVDVVIFMTEASERPHPDDAAVLGKLGNFRHPVILAINKVDAAAKEVLLPQIDAYRTMYDFREIVPISALEGANVALLTELITGMLPEGPRYFPDDQITDLPERFLAAEMIREKIIVLTREEVPYSSAVTIDSFTEDEQRNLLRIRAVIHVEKDSQKGILIGKKGSMLKEIGRQARLEMEKFFAARVFLELFVKVEKNWTQHAGKLRELGYE